MKNLKTLLAGVTAATIALLGGVVVAPSVALAAPSPAADWSWSAPFADLGSGGSWAQPCNGTLTINLNGDRCGTYNGGGYGAIGTDLAEFTQTGNLNGRTMPARDGTPNPAGLGAYGDARTVGPDVSRASSWDTFGYAAVINQTTVGKPSSVTVDVTAALASQGITGLTGDVYVAGADPATGTGSVRVTRSHNGDVTASATALSGGRIRVDFPASALATSWARAWVDVGAYRSDGTQVFIRVLANILDPAYSGSARNLTYQTTVGSPVTIPASDLERAIDPLGSKVTVDPLPATVTETDGGYRFLSDVPTVDVFGFRGLASVDQAFFEVGPGTVTVTAVEEPTGPVDPEPVIVAPAVDDYTFPAPLPGGVAAEVDLLALTHGESFDPREWTVEASDAVRWDVRGGTLLLTPEQDGAALSTTWRWRSVIAPSVTSAWATVTAPAATPVTPEPTPTPDPEPTVTPDPTPDATPTPTVTPDAVSPTPPPGGAKTGDEGLTLLGYGLATLLGTAVAFITRSRRSARR